MWYLWYPWILVTIIWYLVSCLWYPRYPVSNIWYVKSGICYWILIKNYVQDEFNRLIAQDAQRFFWTGKHDQTRSIHINPDQTRSKQINLDQTRSRQINSDQTRSRQINPDQTRSIQINPDQTRSIHINPDQFRSNTKENVCFYLILILIHFHF